MAELQGVTVSPGGVPRIDIYPPTAQPSQGPTDQGGLGGWDAIGQVATTPQAPAAAPATAAAPAGAAGPPAAQGGDALGGWGQVGTPNPSPQPNAATAPDQTGPVSAAGEGAIDALTFGTAPAIAGLSAASGMKYDEVPDDASLSSLGTLAENAGKEIVSPVVGAYELATGSQDALTAYNQARQQALDEQNAEEQNHPTAFLTGELGGAVATLPFTGGAGMAAKAGNVVENAVRAARAGAVGGAAFGGGGAISRGESLPEVAKSAAGGAVAGTVLGAGGSAALDTLGNVGGKVVSAIRGGRDVDAEALRRIVNNLRQDFENEGPQFTPNQVRAAHRAGTPTAIVDAGGERTLALARSAANTSPEARRALTAMAKRRFEQQSERVSRAVRRLGGGAHASLDEEALKTAARKANAPAYKRAYALSERRNPRGIMSPKLEQLLASEAVPAAMQRAVVKGRNRAVAEGLGAFNPKVMFENGLLKFNKSGGPPAFPDLQLWDYTQRALRDMAETAKRAGEKDEAGALMSLHHQLVEELDKRAPEFEQARGTAASFFKAGDALEAGQDFVYSDADIAKAAIALRKMRPIDRELFARGFASQLADEIGKIRNKRNVLNSIFLDSGPARQKIQMALGRDGAAQLEALLRSEEVVDRLRNALGNSTTARQLAEMGLAGGAVATFEGLKEHSFNPAHIIAVALTVGAARHGAKVIDEKVARRVGEMLASNDPAILAKGLQVVSSRPVLMNVLRAANDVTTRELIRYLQPSGVAALGAAAMDHFGAEPPAETNSGGDYYPDDQAAQQH